ncbi:MAG: hypothetical protein B6243_11415 [Anaerolineaceae bacterium 4572_5.2]|nr:MAG: hypothetical protein B6243_11415 [Anaerolineaceae bacterium 4572_5.2]
MLTNTLQTISQLLSAGIAITAFSLLLYALSFNLKNKVARSFAVIMWCVVVVFVGEAVASVLDTPREIEAWSRVQWVGLVCMPSAYLHISDAILATTGRPSRGRRKLVIQFTYILTIGFLIAIPFSVLVGPLVFEEDIAPHLEQTPLTWVFSVYYIISMVWAWVNFARAYNRTVTSSSRRRMRYLIGGALAPALGSYPYLLFGAGFANSHPIFFWNVAVLSNILVSVLIVIMAYSVAFFGVPWPDRVIKRRLVKWVMRGPVTASTVLAATTFVRRTGGSLTPFAPVVMVGTLLIMEYSITIFAPIWERMFLGGDQERIKLIQAIEERLLTTGDLRQLLEAILAAICDRLQVEEAFAASINFQGLEFLVTEGDLLDFQEKELSEKMFHVVKREVAKHAIAQNELAQEEEKLAQKYRLFNWGKYWLMPLFQQDDPDNLLGILGIERPDHELDEEQQDALYLLRQRVSQALEDRYLQQQVFTSLKDITPQMERLQRLRAVTRYDGSDALMAQNGELKLNESDMIEWVKDALSDYWGGPKLSESPLLQLKVMQHALDEHEGVSVKAMRSILKEAIEKVRPEGERKFTLEWILYNILEMKFLRGRKVRDVAKRLAMSEANLYRKQKIAIEVVAKTIIEMEHQALTEGQIEGDAEE